MKEKLRGPIMGKFRKIGNHNIYVDGNDRYVVRVEALDRDADVGASELKKLRDQYGIQIPKFSVSRRKFIANSWNRRKALTTESRSFYVAEHVDGFPLYGNFSVPDNELTAFKGSMDDTCSGLSRYFLDIFESGKGSYLADIHYVQFMYGRTRLNPRNRVILVDVDPFTQRLDRGLEAFLSRGPEQVAEMVLSMEGQIGSKLDNSRLELQKFSHAPSLKPWIKEHAWRSAPSFCHINLGMGRI